MDEFKIEFLDVPEQEPAQIKAALRKLNPPKDCIEDYSFIVRYANNRYWLGHRQTNGRPAIQYGLTSQTGGAPGSG